MSQKWFSFTTRWWQLKYFRNFHPETWGRWTHCDEHIFQRGWNHQLDQRNRIVSPTEHLSGPTPGSPALCWGAKSEAEIEEQGAPGKDVDRGFFSNMRKFSAVWDFYDFHWFSMFNLGAWDETTFFPKWKVAFFESLVEWPWCSQMSHLDRFRMIFRC